jgi:hypothetical protein
MLVINPEKGIASSKRTLETESISEILSDAPGNPILIQSYSEG